MQTVGTNSTRFIRVKRSPEVKERLLINAKVDKNDKDWLIVENCLINGIVLDFPEPYTREYYIEGLERDGLDHLYGLKDYQIEDVAKMSQIDNIANFNRMGYGKTVEAARAMRELQLQTVLIVAPKSVLLQWKEQLERWYPECKGLVQLYRKGVCEPQRGLITITNYETFISDVKLQQFRKFKWDLIICDEAHKIKNHKSKRTKAVKSIPARRHWALTGTPILRLVDDLFSILQFLNPRYVTLSYWNFVYYFCEVKDGFFGQEIKGITQDPVKQEILNILLDYVSIRNPNLNLTPGKNIEYVNIEMDKEQAKLYKNVKNLVLDELPENMTIANGAVLVTRLMQVTSCCQGMIEKHPNVWGAKFDWILETLENNPDEQFVIFSRFAETCKKLQKFLAGNKIETSLYIGALNPQERAESKQSFISGATRCLIGTIGAMGEGVDGLQDAAHNVIFIDKDFSPEINNQAEDRLNRLGQKYNVNVYYLNCHKTYDKHVTKVNLKKSADIRKALKEDE